MGADRYRGDHVRLCSMETVVGVFFKRNIQKLIGFWVFAYASVGCQAALFGTQGGVVHSPQIQTIDAKNTDLAKVLHLKVQKGDLPVRASKVPSGSHDRTLAFVWHAVKPGETLWRLSQKYGVSLPELQRVNGLSERGSTLQAGRRLAILQQGQNGPGAWRKPSTKKGRDSKPHIKKQGDYPFLWPVAGTVTSRFGPRGNRQHRGIDIGAARGTKVMAAAKGTVLFSAKHGSYGNLVILQHDDGLVTVYAHHQRNLVRRGDKVKAGAVIAKVGSTGRSTGPHLHFEVREGKIARDPFKYLPP